MSTKADVITAVTALQVKLNKLGNGLAPRPQQDDRGFTPDQTLASIKTDVAALLTTANALP